MEAIIYREAFIGVSKPYFTYNKITNTVKVLPTIVTEGNTSGATFDPVTDELVTDATEEGLMAKFEALGLKMDEPDSWDFEEKKVQLFMTYEQNAALMQSDYGLDLLSYFKSLNPLPITINKVQGIYIYLSEIYPEHRALLEAFGIRVIDHNI